VFFIGVGNYPFAKIVDNFWVSLFLIANQDETKIEAEFRN
jgi:hypothetical protein